LHTGGSLLAGAQQPRQQIRPGLDQGGSQLGGIIEDQAGCMRERRRMQLRKLDLVASRRA